MIETLTGLIPEDLLDRSGSVFYSGKDAFSGTKPIYLLGLNPGGDPQEMSEEPFGSTSSMCSTKRRTIGARVAMNRGEMPR